MSSISSALFPSKTNFMSWMVSRPVPSLTEIALRKLGQRWLVRKFNNESKTTPLTKFASTFLQSLATKKLNLRRRRHAQLLYSSGSPRSLVMSLMQDWLQAKLKASVSMRYAVRSSLSQPLNQMRRLRRVRLKSYRVCKCRSRRLKLSGRERLIGALKTSVEGTTTSR